jgi:hypothetical protein
MQMKTINYDNSSDSTPVAVDKWQSTAMTNALTENQKNKLRQQDVMPMLYDDNRSMQSTFANMDTPTMESMLATYSLRSTCSESMNSTVDCSSLSKSSLSEISTIVESSPSLSNESIVHEYRDDDNDDEMPSQSSIANKLRRSRRPSTSARQSLANHCRKKRTLPSSDEHSIQVESTTTCDSQTTHPLKGILKRLSPNHKLRSLHTRHVAFHDQVKVLLFESPARRMPKQRIKSPLIADHRRTSTIVTRRSTTMNNSRTSKLFTFTDTTSQDRSIIEVIIQVFESIHMIDIFDR